jgi:hypothetical protein
MNEDRLELLKYLCGAITTLSSAIAEGRPEGESQQVNADIQRDISMRCRRVFEAHRGVMLRLQHATGREPEDR